MSQLRKSLWGYNVTRVHKYMRDFRLLSTLELDDIRRQIAIAKAENAISIGEPIQDTIVEEEIAASMLPVAEEAALPVATTNVATMIPVNKKGNVLEFRRRMEKESPPVETDAFNESGFWGAIAPYLITQIQSEEKVAAQPDQVTMLSQLVAAANTSSGLPSYFNQSLPKVPVYRNPSHSFEHRTSDDTVISNQPPISNQPVTNKQPTQESNESVSHAQGSQAISSEVQQLRYRYIVGKWAGENLLTSQGKLIVGKNTPITQSIVDEADREGLLASLIVNMTLPGLEDNAQ